MGNSHVKLSVQLCEFRSYEELLLMMAPVFFVVLATLPVFAAPEVWDLEGTDRIIGGGPAAIDEFPFIVALLYLKKNKTIKHGCGGTIITKDWVLTAFHCADPGHLLTHKQYQLINIRAGSSFAGRRGVLRGVVETVSHDYPQHDIALVKVNKSWPLNGVTISLARLPRKDDPIPVGSPATIMGWGDTDGKGTSPEILMKQEVEIISPILCNESWWFWDNRTIDERKMCTLFKTPKKGSLASYGDTGSPVLVNGEVVGITSKRHQKYGAVPNIHTRVSSYMDWIEENMGPRLPTTKVSVSLSSVIQFIVQFLMSTPTD